MAGSEDVVKRCIRHWLVGFELDELAKRSSFDHIAPERVLGVLHQLAGLHLQNDRPWGVSRTRLGAFRRSLLRIWELAHDQQQKNDAQHLRWRRVMAICNGLYPSPAAASPAGFKLASNF